MPLLIYAAAYTVSHRRTHPCANATSVTISDNRIDCSAKFIAHFSVVFIANGDSNSCADYSKADGQQNSGYKMLAVTKSGLSPECNELEAH